MIFADSRTEIIRMRENYGNKHVIFHELTLPDLTFGTSLSGETPMLLFGFQNFLQSIPLGPKQNKIN